MAEALQNTLWGPPVKSEVEIYPEEISQEEKQLITDPRPDLTYDSEAWTKLLKLAREKSKMLAGTIHGFRCAGLRLHRGGKGYALRPDFDPKTSIWVDKEDYEIDRNKWLIPYQKEIIELLSQL